MREKIYYRLKKDTPIAKEGSEVSFNLKTNSICVGSCIHDKDSLVASFIRAYCLNDEWLTKE